MASRRGILLFALLAGAAAAACASASPGRAGRVPLTLTWPTSVAVNRHGFLLVAAGGNQTGNGRVLHINPASGKSTVVARADEAYSVAVAPSGPAYLSAALSLLRLDGAGGTTQVAQADGDIGPVAVAANGDVYFETETKVWKVAGGTGAPTQVADQLSSPHGLAVTSDTAYVVDASTHRVVHLMIDGRRLGSVRHVFYDPYAVAAAADGSVYVVDTSESGRLYRVAPSGKTRVVSRRTR